MKKKGLVATKVRSVEVSTSYRLDQDLACILLQNILQNCLEIRRRKLDGLGSGGDRFVHHLGRGTK